ncbi:MAG: hypothetical protein A2Z20_08345 [Bdellovibrionales bacterium RBG_16_40_8]|nr:MAG: hypothetical protein A2Z20_08345 [Bdellovibrionales bacterium RBG_16_40_8]
MPGTFMCRKCVKNIVTAEINRGNMKPIYETNILINFRDADPQGILYFARTYDLAHNCLEAFWAQTSLGWNFWFKNPEFAVPLRHSNCDYLHAMPAGETFNAQLAVAKIGESSVEFICKFTKKNGSICAQVSTTHVFVDRKTFTKISVPDIVRSFLQTL